MHTPRFPLLVFLAFWLMPLPARAQIYTFSTDMFNPVQGTVKVRVLQADDSPVEFASVYLKAKNDTLITNFTLSDTTGLARLEKVTRGTYNLTVEMLGFKTYSKEHYFNFSQNSKEKDLGVIRLGEDHEVLDAAHVTAIGNPIEVRQDTIIFNAASFTIGQNAMLEDLLKRMPGMEVSSDGSVKYNGETIQKITVGGKTFFFDDPKMALKNLPAQVVDKVKVIDKVSDSEQFSGVATDREKVMDLEFKKEFQHGWFGNAKAGAGSTLAGDRKDEMVDNRGFLYNGNVMVSGYNDKDQIVVIGNAYNAPMSDDGAVIVFISGDGDELLNTGTGGIQTYRQLGANYNTTRLKGLESTAMASYGHSFNDARNRASRTTWVTDGSDIFSRSEAKQFTTSDLAKVSLEIKNTDRKKFLFNLEPTFRFTAGKAERYNDDSASSAEGGSLLNSSTSGSYMESNQFQTDVSFTTGIRNLGDKRRNLTLSGSGSLTDYAADSREYSQTQVLASPDPNTKDLFYVTDNRNYGGNARLTYVEPLAKDWVLSLTTGGNVSVRDNGKDAFDRTDGAAGFEPSLADRSHYAKHNDYYSSQMKNTYVTLTQSAQFQYKKDQTSVQLGFQTQETRNETYSKVLGRETATGIGEWLFDWNPYLNFRWSKKQSHFSFYYSGNSLRPSVANQLPVLDISVPTRLKAGNIYLRPGYRHWANVSINLNNPEKQRNLSLTLYGNLYMRQVVTASWFDTDGIQYSIPVNSGKPSFSPQLSANFGLPLSRNKKLRLNGYLSASLSHSVSYQNTRRIDGLDTDNFDYMQFMGWFWGDEAGERFYGGQSGFRESLTNSVSVYPSLTLRYRGEQVTISLSGSTSFNSSHYSLDPAADTRTWSSTLGGSFDWTASHQWEFTTRGGYHFFNGFPEGFNEPYTSWSFGVTRNIKAWAISLRIEDILNNSRNTRHIATANYVEDTMRNMLGRRFFLSVKWNFGKLNAAKNRSATNAAVGMMY